MKDAFSFFFFVLALQMEMDEMLIWTTQKSFLFNQFLMSPH